MNAIDALWRFTPEWREWERRQLEERPLCAWHLQNGLIAVATIADRVPIGFYDDRVVLESMCKACFEHKWAPNPRGYVDDIGLDGLPLDPRHVFNRKPRPRRRP